jgi:hypothetical protein
VSDEVEHEQGSGCLFCVELLNGSQVVGVAPDVVTALATIDRLTGESVNRGA